ncbi:MAG: PD-(D/E)XK nuclease family protein, partial [Candidatus Gastranaerophilales bacterium]|nr:PD-(D/E)XK nuclease family protein [Candidatus Gastranaerophilales bacterium]
MTINNFSPNMLKTYQTCPKKFFFKYVERVNVPLSSAPFEKGKKIHALANYFLQGVNISRLETALTDSEREIWQALLNNPFFQKKCFKSEYQLSCKLSEFWLGGRLDA